MLENPYLPRSMPVNRRPGQPMSGTGQLTGGPYNEHERANGRATRARPKTTLTTSTRCFRTGQKLLPGLGSNRFVDWAGWAGNSETFNLVSRPAHPSWVPDPNRPFGLITLAPATGNMQVRFEQAVFAALNPDQTRARVVFPARHGDGTLDYPIPTQADTWSSAARQACGDW